jgi:dTDP-4-dehydrorhamnose 3,5-epimerase
VNVTKTPLDGVLLIEPRVFQDPRGAFFEAFNARRYADAGIPGPFVQDNISVSARGVLRGLHFQHPFAQGKLVQVLRGAVFDVAVDIRRGSPTFGRWFGQYLSSENRLQLFIPAGFAHGFLSLCDDTLFTYKCTERFHPEAERTIRWDDPAIGIAWPLIKGDRGVGAGINDRHCEERSDEATHVQNTGARNDERSLRGDGEWIPVQSSRDADGQWLSTLDPSALPVWDR